MNKLTTKSFDYIERTSLPDKVAELLFDLSPFKGDSGFSYMVRKRYVEEYLKDLKNDLEEFPHLMDKPWHETAYIFLSELIAEMKTDYLFVNQ